MTAPYTSMLPALVVDFKPSASSDRPACIAPRPQTEACFGYGGCQEEAINNLQNELASREAAGEGESHAG